MKRSEVILWIMVAIALAANIWLPRHLGQRYSWDRDLSQRLAADFCLTRDEVKEQIRERYPYVSEADIDVWTASGKLESMEIGRRTMYFHNAVPNLFRMLPELSPQSVGADTAAQPMPPEARMRVRFSLTVPVNTIRPGKTLRCWLPYPRADVARQTGIKFIEAGVDSTAYPMDRIVFSDPSCPHGSLYMEAKTNRYKDVTFYEVFEYTSSEESHALDETMVLPYDTSTDSYKEFTSEYGKHIVFTDRIRSLADSLTLGIENPWLQAKAIFTWIDRNIPWASAREYSTIENIPEYVLANGHGDCGQKTLLFMTLCRCKGIPTRWQSGLMMHPGKQNLHDWCEAYFEGCGWVPVDQSFGIGRDGSYFYLGGIDAWRLVVNNGLGAGLSPEKTYPRSDDVDFQRGEVEWERGNLYYNQWSYDFQIEYL